MFRRRLSAGEWSQINTIRDEWLAHGLAAYPADRSAAEAAITRLYREMRQPTPQFVWVDSPAAAYLSAWVLGRPATDPLIESLRHPVRGSLLDPSVDPMHASLYESLHASLGRVSMGGSLRDSLRGTLGRSMVRSLRRTLHTTMASSLRSSLGRELHDSLYDSLRGAMGGPLHESLRRSLGRSLPALLQGTLPYSLLESLQQACWGQHDAAWIAFFDAPRKLGLVHYDRDAEQSLETWAILARSCGWWWPYENICLVSERPVDVRVEPWPHRPGAVRLHNENGPSLSFRDGWKVYAWHGVRVPQSVVEEPELLTGLDWLSEHNSEVRRIIAERMGYDKLLDCANTRRVAADEWGTLWKVIDPTGQDEDIVLLDVLNSTPEPDGSAKKYVLRVPPRFGDKKARPVDAIGWTFGLPRGSYHPDVMT